LFTFSLHSMNMISAFYSHTIVQNFEKLSGTGPCVAMYALSFKGLYKWVSHSLNFSYAKITKLKNYIYIWSIDVLLFLCFPL